MNTKLVALAATGLLAGPLTAQAVPVIFTNEEAFVTATGASLANPPPSPSSSLQGGLLQIGPTLELDVASGINGGVFEVFDQTHFVSCGVQGHCLQDLADTTDSPILGISDRENFYIRSWDRTGGGPTPPLNPLYAFGFNIYEPISVALGTHTALVMCSLDNTIACAESTFHIALQNGNVGVAAFDFQPDDDQWAFWGVQSDIAFNVITVSETIGGIENDYFTRFYYATSFMTPQPTTSVPEPGTLSLFALGLFGLGVAKRRRLHASTNGAFRHVLQPSIPKGSD